MTEKTVSFDKIGASKPVIRSKGKDEQDQQEKLDYDHQRVLTEQIKQANLDARTNRDMRRDYGKAVFRYLLGYSIFAGLVVVLAGWGTVTGFMLPVAVLTALVGSTAVSAIGLVGIVVTGLFRPNHGNGTRPGKSFTRGNDP